MSATPVDQFTSLSLVSLHLAATHAPMATTTEILRTLATVTVTPEPRFITIVRTAEAVCDIFKDDKLVRTSNDGRTGQLTARDEELGPSVWDILLPLRAMFGFFFVVFLVWYTFSRAFNRRSRRQRPPAWKEGRFVV
ncbi:hypothetical protein OQA88_5844 [Cercophora sp. LCS_1]